MSHFDFFVFGRWINAVAVCVFKFNQFTKNRSNAKRSRLESFRISVVLLIVKNKNDCHNKIFLFEVYIWLNCFCVFYFQWRFVPSQCHISAGQQRQRTQRVQSKCNNVFPPTFIECDSFAGHCKEIAQTTRSFFKTKISVNIAVCFNFKNNIYYPLTTAAARLSYPLFESTETHTPPLTPNAV